VSVLGINPRQADHIAGFDIPNRIALHCGNAVAARIVSGDLSAGVLLLFEAADLGADMIVMGAYGQSHLREFIMAGT
jgi:nucleotide-binding universal stress UspA family protein